MNDSVRRDGSESARLPRALLGCLGLLMLPLLGLAGCSRGPIVLSSAQQTTIDRTLVEYPSGTELKPYITGLVAPSAITFDNEGSLIVAESGIDGRKPRILGFKRDGTQFNIYPQGRHLPNLPFGLGKGGFRMYGPIGGIVYAHGKLYVTHRDANDRGVITALNYDGTHTTIVADLPAQGDHSVTDIIVHRDGRLWFGIGTATNSGVVGLDNMRWLREHRGVADRPWGGTYLLGRRFDTPNPFAGLFGGADIAVTAPFQPFDKSIETFIPPAPNGKPNGAILSVAPDGGDLRFEAHGIRYPVGLGLSEPGQLYATNQGMKLRGTRPVRDDPDVMLQVINGQWYGWPDYTANMKDIRTSVNPQFLPPVEMLVKSGYRDLSFLIDHERSGLPASLSPTNLLSAEFRPLSGAAKFDFAPASGPFSRLRQGGNIAIVALWGDRAPFDTGPLKLAQPTGYKVVQVNVDDRQVTDFIRNTSQGPASKNGVSMALERPIDVKFGPDGAMYILDFGHMDMKKSKERVRGATGKVWRLIALEQ